MNSQAILTSTYKKINSLKVLKVRVVKVRGPFDRISTSINTEEIVSVVLGGIGSGAGIWPACVPGRDTI